MKGCVTFKLGSTFNNTKNVLIIFTVAACLPHPTVTFGTLSSVKTKHDFGESVTIICDVGYYISSGDDERTCQNDGNWSGTEPICSSKYSRRNTCNV